MANGDAWRIGGSQKDMVLIKDGNGLESNELGRSAGSPRSDRCCSGEEAISGTTGRRLWLMMDDEMSSSGTVCNSKSLTNALQTAQWMSFSPTMLRALVMQAEQSRCLQGTRTAIRSPAQPQTEQAVCDDLAEETLNISEHEF